MYKTFRKAVKSIDFVFRLINKILFPNETLQRGTKFAKLTLQLTYETFKQKKAFKKQIYYNYFHRYVS